MEHLLHRLYGVDAPEYHRGWKSSKIISRLVSLECSLFATPTYADLLQGGTHRNLRLNRGGWQVRKKWLSAYKSSLKRNKGPSTKVTIEVD